MASNLLIVQFIIAFTIMCIVIPTHSKNLRSKNHAVVENIIPDAEFYEDEEIDDLLLASFDEMEKQINEEKYRQAVTSESTDIILSDMLLDEVNCLEKIIAGEDINCSVASH